MFIVLIVGWFHCRTDTHVRASAPGACLGQRSPFSAVGDGLLHLHPLLSDPQSE